MQIEFTTSTHVNYPGFHLKYFKTSKAGNASLFTFKFRYQVVRVFIVFGILRTYLPKIHCNQGRIQPFYKTVASLETGF